MVLFLALQSMGGDSPHRWRDREEWRGGTPKALTTSSASATPSDVGLVRPAASAAPPLRCRPPPPRRSIGLSPLRKL
uniref:Uncharacterized protein n=1 Tax=Oryza rufipogon TaxID=4529 RepID=A0A0E0QQY4_ORYRU